MQNEPLDRRSPAEWFLSQNADVALWLERRDDVGNLWTRLKLDR